MKIARYAEIMGPAPLVKVGSLINFRVYARSSILHGPTIKQSDCMFRDIVINWLCFYSILFLERMD